MTSGKFGPMRGQQEMELARQLMVGSDVLDFETALRIAQSAPAKAEKLVRQREEDEKLLEELAHANRRVRLSVRELA